jgi:hypothetical protein
MGPTSVETSTKSESIKYKTMMGELIYDLHLELIDSKWVIPVPTDTGGADGFGLKDNGFRIHNGHSILRRSKIYNHVQYPDGGRGEDAIFNRTVIKTFGRTDDTMMMINTPLSYYLQQYSSVNFLG